MLKIVVIMLAILASITIATPGYAREKSLTKDVVKKAIAERAVRAKFCKLITTDKEIKTFGYFLNGLIHEDMVYNSLPNLKCDDNNSKEIIYGILRMVFVDTESREDLFDEVFLIDDEIIVNDGGSSTEYPDISEEIDFRNSKDFYRIVKGVKSISGRLVYPYDKNLSVKNAPDPDETAPIKTGYYVNADPEGNVTDIYFMYNEVLYKFVEKIKEIKDVTLVDYTNEISASPTPDPASNAANATANWKTFSNSHFSVKYPTQFDNWEVLCNKPSLNVFSLTKSDESDLCPVLNPPIFLHIKAREPEDAVEYSIEYNSIPKTECANVIKESVTVDGIIAEKYTATIKKPLRDGCFWMDEVVIKFSRNNIKYNLVYYPERIDARIAEQILSTFQFTN